MSDDNDINIDSILETPSDVSDIWNKLNMLDNTSSFMLYFNAHQKYTMRLLGPYLSVDRIYIPKKQLAAYMDTNQLAKLLHEKDINLLKDVVYKLTRRALEQEEIRQLANGGGPSNVVVSTLNKYSNNKSVSDFLVHFFMHNNFNWTRCILVNVLESNTIKIATLSRAIGMAIFSEIVKLQKGAGTEIKINGLFAHDITIEKRERTRRQRNRAINSGNRWNATYDRQQDALILGASPYYSETNRPVSFSYNIQPSPASYYLNDSQVNMILKNKLIDLKKFVNDSNEKLNTPFYYKLNSSYQMPEEYMKMLKNEADEKIEGDHLKFVEDDIDKLPEEAFENRNKVNNSMANLHLDL